MLNYLADTGGFIVIKESPVSGGSKPSAPSR